MSEDILDLRGVEKTEAYERLVAHANALLDGTTDEITAMSTMASLLHHGFGHLWTGFYRVVEPNKLLRVGPYQGTVGCLEITFGKGVCGDAALSRSTVTVADVALYPGHISCDARSRSEIVVPVTNRAGELIAVLDVDSELPGAFDEDDRRGLEELVRWFSRQ